MNWTTDKPTEAGWTSTKPTEAGWYWFRDLSRPYEDEREPYVVKVRQYAQHLAVGNCRLEGAPYGRGEWLGPITPTDRQQGKVAGIGECKDLVDSFAEAYLLASMVAHSLSPEIHKCIAEFVSSVGGEMAKLAQAAQDENGVGDA